MIRSIVLACAVLAAPVASALTPVRLSHLNAADAEHPLHAETLGEALPIPSRPQRDADNQSRPQRDADNQSRPQRDADNQSRPQRDAHDRLTRFDVLHYALDIAADPTTGVIIGANTITFRAMADDLDSIVLDAVDMDISEVRDLAGNALVYRYDGELLTIALRQPLATRAAGAVVVHYRALAPQSLNLTHPDATDAARMTAAYTYTEPQGSPTWFPCLDRPSDKATLTLTVAVPAGQRALANGVLTEVKQQRDGASRFSYRMEQPIATYLVSLSLGAYDTYTIGTFKGKPLTLWTPPRIAAQALSETRDTQRMMEIFSAFTGFDYPFSSYAQSIAEAYRTSMEHQSATTMGGARITGDDYGIGVVAHELAHQWFGDWVTCRTWGNLWLNEGFATYLPRVFFEGSGQTNRAWNEISWWRDGYFEEARTRVHPLSEATVADVEAIFDSHAYEKGALVINYLRWLAERMPIVHAATEEQPVASSTFSEILRHYLTRNGGRTATSESLQASFEHVTGQSWQAVFDQWTRTPGHPQLAMTYTAAGGHLSLRIEQQQATRRDRRWPAFSFVLPIEILLADGTWLAFDLDIYDEVQTFEIDTTAAAVAVAADPQWSVPAEIDMMQSGDAWRAVLGRSPHVATRVNAVRALLQLGTTELDQATLATIAADSMPLVSAAAIEALTSSPLDDATRASVQHLAAALRRPRPDVPTLAALYDAERWLVESDDAAPTTAEQQQWRERFVASRSVYERKALLAMLGKADLAASQTFAIEQMSARDYTTFDELSLLDHLTAHPSPAIDAWAETALRKDGLSLIYLGKTLQNLAAAGYDRPGIAESVIDIASTHRNLTTRALAVELLGKQTSSRAQVCPALSTLAEAGEHASRPTALAEIRSAAIAARVELGCQ